MPPKAVFITNIPAPYRLPVYEDVGKNAPFEWKVIFAAGNEANRGWGMDDRYKFPHLILDSTRTLAKRDGFNFVHHNGEIWTVLKRENPDCVILSGMNPIHLQALSWAYLHRRKIIFFTDGWQASEESLGRWHRLARRVLYPRADAMIGPSRKTLDLYVGYGVAKSHCFQSHLCVDNDAFRAHAQPFADRTYDVLFAGNIVARKMPLFFAEVCKALAAHKPNLRAAVVGAGDMTHAMKDAMQAANVACDFLGFAAQHELPGIYGNARLLLFPTQFDAWGVVANEALAAGTPVITTPRAGCADELIVEGVTGRVLAPEVTSWTSAALGIIGDARTWSAYSDAGLQAVQAYNRSAAAAGIESAVVHALHLNASC